MSFISVLKKIGTVIVDAAGIVSGVGPLISNVIPANSKEAQVVSASVSDLTQLANIVTTVETAFAAVSSAQTGPLKLQAAAPLISQFIQQSTMLAGKKIANPTLFNQGIVDLTNGIVEVLNSLDAGSVSVQGTGASAPSSTGAVPPPAATIPAVLSPAPAAPAS